jgi:transcription elongation factor GreA
MQKFPMTKSGLQKLEAELKLLKYTERPEIIKAISFARDHGDLSENAEYHAAREKQAFVEGRILELESKLSRAEVIETAGRDLQTVTFGATVHVENQDTEEKKIYTVVSEYETDLSKGLISTSSPVGKALITKKVGDIIEVSTPKGLIAYEILKIEYKDIEI